MSVISLNSFIDEPYLNLSISISHDGIWYGQVIGSDWLIDNDWYIFIKNLLYDGIRVGSALEKFYLETVLFVLYQVGK